MKEKKMSEDNSIKKDIERIMEWAKQYPPDEKVRKKEAPADIYFITDGEYVKIGTTKNLNKRLKALQTSNPKKLKVLYAFTTDWPYTIESGLHKNCKNKHVRCEWYDILDDFRISNDMYFTPTDIEHLLNIKSHQVRKLINELDFPILKIGHSSRIPALDLCSYLYTHVVVCEDRRLVINNRPLSLS